jgi:GNAT superfamily N-acetyltransferase
MTAIAIRQADRDDLPAVLALLAELDPAGTPPMALADAVAVWERMAAYPYYRVLIADAPDAPALGTYTLCILDNLGHRGTPAGLVENVVVAAAARGRGVGRLMMEDALARCRAHGCYKMALSSNLARTDAHAFYDRLGFARHGVSFRVDC